MLQSNQFAENSLLGQGISVAANRNLPVRTTKQTLHPVPFPELINLCAMDDFYLKDPSVQAIL